MPQDAVLTVLWIELCEQRHFLITGSGSPMQFRRWLSRLQAAQDSLISAASPDAAEALILTQGLHEMPTPCLDDERPSYRYLLTIGMKRRRVLLSAWRRQGIAGGWRRVWLPRQIRGLPSASPPPS